MFVPELTLSAWLRFDSIRRSLRKASPRRVLEVGAGEGALGAWLARRVDYVGVEPDDSSRTVAVARIRASGGGELRRSVADLEPSRQYDAVCAFEVLEHIDDDAVALRLWRSKLMERGYLLLSVPAHASRFGISDTYVGHFRRYDRSSLQQLLEAEGFEVLQWHSYGAGLGQLLDGLRNMILARRERTRSAAEGTALSGRLFQPKSSMRVLFNYLAALPFRALQTPFAATDTGIGYVVLARRR